MSFNRLSVEAQQREIAQLRDGAMQGMVPVLQRLMAAHGGELVPGQYVLNSALGIISEQVQRCPTKAEKLEMLEAVRDAITVEITALASTRTTCTH